MYTGTWCHIVLITQHWHSSFILSLTVKCRIVIQMFLVCKCASSLHRCGCASSRWEIHHHVRLLSVWRHAQSTRRSGWCEGQCESSSSSFYISFPPCHLNGVMWSTLTYINWNLNISASLVDQYWWLLTTMVIKNAETALWVWNFFYV